MTGVVHTGLSDMSGTHPRPGSRYRVVGVDAEGHREELLVELVADDGRLMHLCADNGSVSVAVRLRTPANPRHVDLVAVAAVADHGLARGDIRVEAQLDVGVGTGHELPPTPLCGRVHHRRVQARFTVDVGRRVEGRWDVALVARGRGLFRPVAAVALRMFNGRIEAELQRALAELVGPLGDQAAELVGRGPDSIAAELVAAWIDDLAGSLTEPDEPHP